MATKPYTTTNGQAADGGQVESNFQEIYSNITNDNIASNAGIDISKTDLGTFTPWTSWTTTAASYGTMGATITAQTCQYTQIGKVVFFNLSVTVTTTNIAAAAITMSLPITPAASASVTANGFVVWDGTNSTSSFARVNGGSIDIFKYDASNWTIGTGRSASIHGFYKVA